MSSLGVETESQDEMSKAILLSKSHLIRAFQGEHVQNLGLEEIKQDINDFHQWQVTWGFDRHWEYSGENTFLRMAAQAAAARPQRIYKVVTVDLNTGKGLSIVNRKDD